jgi:hypothetical protein
VDQVAGSVDALGEEISALHEGLRAAEAAASGASGVSGTETAGGVLPGPTAALPPATPPSPPGAS